MRLVIFQKGETVKKTSRAWRAAPLVVTLALTFGLARAQDTGPCLNTQPCAKSGSTVQPSVPPEAGKPATVNCRGTHGLAVFKEPGAVNIIGTLACGESLTVLKTGIGRENRVAEVRTGEIPEGYVYQAFLDLAGEAETAPPEPALKPLTNESIKSLVSAGLSAETIISMVNTQPGQYSLDADSVVALKKAGVPEKVIDAMINATTRTPDLTSATPAETPSITIPNDPGLYAVVSDGSLRHIAGRPTSFVRTGSLLASGLTAGIHARRMNTQIAGESAYVTVGHKPVFYYRVAQNAPDQVVPGTLSLILTQMTVKPGRRQFELDANGILRKSQGISVRHQSNFDAQEIEPGVYELRPDELKSGQYAFFLYVAGPIGEDTEHTASRTPEREALRGFLYDFQVE